MPELDAKDPTGTLTRAGERTGSRYILTLLECNAEVPEFDGQDVEQEFRPCILDMEVIRMVYPSYKEGVLVVEFKNGEFFHFKAEFSTFAMYLCRDQYEAGNG